MSAYALYRHQFVRDIADMEVGHVRGSTSDMRAQSRCAMQVLGSFTVRIDGHRIVLRPSAQRILAALAVHGALPRLTAAELLWPDLPHARALGNLRTALWRVRHDGPGLVIEEGAVVYLAEIHVDLVEVREWVWRTLRGEDPWMPMPQRAVLDLLPGWGDNWLVEPREELRLLELHAMEASAQRLLLAGRLGEAAGLALAAVGVDPLRESANRLLIEIHLREGNRSDAIRQFRKYEQLLRREMDTEPGSGLAALVGSFIAVGPPT